MSNQKLYDDVSDNTDNALRNNSNNNIGRVTTEQVSEIHNALIEQDDIKSIDKPIDHAIVNSDIKVDAGTSGVSGEEDAIGGTDEPETITKLPYQEYNVETLKDNSDMFEISGFAVTRNPGHILVCDHGNQIIKLVDQDFNVINRYPVVFQPWGIAVVDDIYIVVTFPFVRLVQYLKFKSPTRIVAWFPLKAQNEYYGICADIDKIVAICKYDNETSSCIPSVHVMDRKGNVDVVIDKDSDGCNLFIEPNHIALNRSTKVIYVSDQGSKTVISLSITGRILARFANRNVEPIGIAVDQLNGNVFVNNAAGESVIHLCRDLKNIQTITCKDDRMRNAHALTYCSRTDRLVIGIGRSPYIRVFII